jgi:hypothetical protein
MEEHLLPKCEIERKVFFSTTVSRSGSVTFKITWKRIHASYVFEFCLFPAQKQPKTQRKFLNWSYIVNLQLQVGIRIRSDTQLWVI